MDKWEVLHIKTMIFTLQNIQEVISKPLKPDCTSKMSFTWAAGVSSSALSGAHWKEQRSLCPLGDIHQGKNIPESQTSPGTSVQTWVCVWGIHCCVPPLWNDFSNHWPHPEIWFYASYLRPASEAAACVSVISSHFYKMYFGTWITEHTLQLPSTCQETC